MSKLPGRWIPWTMKTNHWNQEKTIYGKLVGESKATLWHRQRLRKGKVEIRGGNSSFEASACDEEERDRADVWENVVTKGGSKLLVTKTGEHKIDPETEILWEDARNGIRGRGLSHGICKIGTQLLPPLYQTNKQQQKNLMFQKVKHAFNS